MKGLAKISIIFLLFVSLLFLGSSIIGKAAGEITIVAPANTTVYGAKAGTSGTDIVYDSLNFTVNVANINLETGNNIYGDEINVVSGTHCQDGSSSRYWENVQIFMPDDTSACTIL